MEQIEQLIKGCAAGKRKSQEELYRRFAPKMFMVCLYYTKDRSAAEDVLQDGFVKVLQNFKQFKNRGSLEGWIRRIMVNTAIERFRKENYLYAVSDVEAVRDDLVYDDLLAQITAKELEEIIKQLTPQYRIVFCLYALEGYSHKEIGEKLNISEGTSKSNLSRARTILKKKVQDLYYLEGRKKVGT